MPKGHITRNGDSRQAASSMVSQWFVLLAIGVSCTEVTELNASTKKDTHVECEPGAINDPTCVQLLGRGAVCSSEGKCMAKQTGLDAGFEHDSGFDAGHEFTTEFGPLVPVWNKTFIEAVSFPPRVGLLRNGQVIGAFDSSYQRNSPYRIGEGEPGELLITEEFKPVVFWLNADGTMQHAVQLIRQLAPQQHTSGVIESLSIASDNSAFVVGKFQGPDPAVFHAGSPIEQTLEARQRLVGDTLHHTEEPFIVRYGPDRNPSWTRYGQTPGPLTKTWFNGMVACTPMLEDSVAVTGKFDGPGFSTFLGSSSPVTFSADGGAYVARLDATGQPQWTVRLSQAVPENIVSGPDGSIFLLFALLGPTTVVDADSAAPVIISKRESRDAAIVKLSPNGSIVWVRQLSTNNAIRPSLEADPSGGGTIAQFITDLTFWTTDDRLLERSVKNDGGILLARLASDGELDWSTFMPDELASAGYPIIHRGAGDAMWLITQAALPLSGTAATLSASLPNLADAWTLLLLHHLNSNGDIQLVGALGTDLPIQDFAANANELVIIGNYTFSQTPKLFDSLGATALPPAIEGSDLNLFIAKYALPTNL